MSPLIDRNFDRDDKEVFFDEGVQQQFFELIRGATESIIFVTPYIELWVHLKDEMRDAIARNVDVTFLIREGETPRRPEDLEWLYANKVKVYLVPNLHAKIYLNEKTVLVSSMNIHRTSIIDSKDFAMIVKNEDDAKMFREYVSRLVGKATLARTSPSVRDRLSDFVEKATIAQSVRSFQHQTSQDGYCIRSRDKIPFNTEKPLCAECFRQWNKYQDEDYAEKYCHSCGKSVKTTFAKPLCMDCWKKSN
jgi:phosphatidylserine/phosphatidylglycerophosphate/cardiolipin synthase-like enzyme